MDFFSFFRSKTKKNLCEDDTEEHTSIEEASAVRILRPADILRGGGRGTGTEDDTACFFNWHEIYPQLALLRDNVKEIAKEAQSVEHWTPWPEEHYDMSSGGARDWKVFPFVYTFPAIDESKKTWVDSTCSMCPKTAAFLKKIPNLRTALFSRMGPFTTLSAHTGWEDLANDVLRCHLGLRIPDGNLCGVEVTSQIQMHRQGEILVFDDSKLHLAFNESSEERLVLIVDLLRPSHIPRGKATGGHTKELDAMISNFHFR